MGIPVGSKTIQLELRYSEINVVKNLSTDEVSVIIPYQIGFFGEDGKWVVEKADYIAATGDAAMILFGVTPAMIGGDANSPMGELINRLAYAIVSGQIKVTAQLLVENVTSTDASVPAPEQLSVKILKDGTPIRTMAITVGAESTEFPAMLGVSLQFSAPGFDPVVVSVPVLQGTYQIATLTLSPTEQNSEDTDETPATDDPNDPNVDDGDGEPEDGGNE